MESSLSILASLLDSSLDFPGSEDILYFTVAKEHQIHKYKFSLKLNSQINYTLHITEFIGTLHAFNSVRFIQQMNLKSSQILYFEVAAQLCRVRERDG